MVLLVTLILGISAVSAIDTNDSAANIATTDNVVNAESNTNIESNSIKNTVSNEYETITNDNSSTDKAITKKTTKSSKNTKTSTDKQQVIIETNPITAYANQLITINANVTYQNGEKVDDAKAAIKINDNTIAQTRVTNGMISYTYELPKWHAKVYDVTIIVGETPSIQTSIKNTTLTIQRHNVKISMDDYTVLSAANTKLKAIVKYENGSYVNGTKAVFKINGKTVGSTIVNNGEASINTIVPTKAKTYTLVFKVGESTVSNYNDCSADLIVKKRTPAISTDVLYFASKGNSVTFKATLIGTGYANASGKLGFKVNGKTVATVQMENSTATYKYDVSKLSPGTHDVSIVYGGSNALNEVRRNVSLRVQSDLVSTYTYNQILDKANTTYQFILDNKRLPNYLTLNENQILIPDYLYLLTQVVSYNNSYHNGGFSAPAGTATTTKYGTQINKSECISLAKKIVQSYISKGKAPSSIKTDSGVSLSYKDTVYVFTRLVSFIRDNNRLPNYVTVAQLGYKPTDPQGSASSGSSGSSGSSASTSTSTYVPTNTVPANYASYLVSAKNAYVNSTALKNAVQAATRGVSGAYNQAVAIFNYVNDHTDYSSYMNTRYGALETLRRGYGNCVDQGHLLLGMYRTANLPARYCHATCYFRSGLVIGHVWVEVYVNGRWYSCDTTSNRNSFGNIVNWYSSTTVRRYTILPF
ncbi:MAG: hypothetical protein BZ138_05245 [Methanosphaera sp. rholeuAM270]|nr:MAG: hypothetical protein BZ138_05245 [Methanosphaera sp. rholeuAM270]